MHMNINLISQLHCSGSKIEALWKNMHPAHGTNGTFGTRALSVSGLRQCPTIDQFKPDLETRPSAFHYVL